MTKTEDEDKKEANSKNESVDDLELDDESQESETPKIEKSDEEVSFSKSKIILVKKLLENIKDNNEKLIQLLSGTISEEDEARISIGQLSENISDPDEQGDDVLPGGRVIEGVFDGENMIGPDGKEYSVPANYASKSKLIEGDILKLTITPTGTFVYKQIGPIERNRLVAKLEQGNSGNYIALVDDKKWRVLTASVTYFKGHDGDEIIILVPKAGESKWAAVENIVKKAA